MLSLAGSRDINLRGPSNRDASNESVRIVIEMMNTRDEENWTDSISVLIYAKLKYLSLPPR